MAGFLAMLRWRDDARAAAVEAQRRTLEALCARRGVRSWYDRFERTRIRGPAGTLQVDRIDVAPQAPTLVFAPGTNAYGLLYGELLAALADRGAVNVVTFDPRGHGLSDGARGSYSLPDVVDDLGAVVDWTRARVRGALHVGGSSQGGIAAFYLAAERDARGRIASAVCHNLADLGAAESARLTRAPRLSRVARPLVRGLARLVPELPVPIGAYLDLAREPVAGVGTARDVLRTDPLVAPFVRLRTLASLATAPLPRPVEEIDVPVLALQAGADTIFPTDYVAALVARIRAPKRLVVYEGLPHYVVVDHVDRVLGDVLAWIRERSVAPTEADAR